MRSLHTNPLLRRLLLPLLKRFNPGDIRLRHHYTDGPLMLHSYRHKGYWFHGRRREQQTMTFFRQVLKQGDNVIEVGGHIGYLSMYFAELVGQSGKVVVFEPGSNNLPYIRSNVAHLPQIQLIEQAVSDENGVSHFYEEELTGQNNSLHKDYAIFDQNCQRAFANAQYRQNEVPTIRLDTFLESNDVKPKLLKIDIEGAEILALKGCGEIMSSHYPIVMVEVTNRKHDVFSFLSDYGYSLFSDTGQLLSTAKQLDFNVCALHPNFHAKMLCQLGWKVPING